jgi:peptidoglycan/LPS O-acetylase OafA/YrhL
MKPGTVQIEGLPLFCMGVNKKLEAGLTALLGGGGTLAVRHFNCKRVPGEWVVESEKTQRIRSLDGLRGLAALIVVVHHSLLAVPALAWPYFPDSPSTSDPITWILVNTPVHLLWGGTEAVYIFFVLSGVVLTLPARRQGFSWRAYYPSRLVRLYLPVLAAICLGYLSVLLVPRVGVPGLSDWLILTHSSGISLMGIVKDATLVTGTSGLITPLWSLQWEVLFSLMLPLYIAFASVKAIAVGRAIGTRFGIVFLGLFVGLYLGKMSILYLLMFAVGVLFATALSSLRELGERITRSRHGTWIWSTMAVLAALFLSAHWTGFAFGLSSETIAYLIPVEVLGAVLAVFLASFWPGARSFLESRVTQWLGTISFSLYLVHEPIVVSIGFLLGPGDGVWVFPLAIAPCLLAAHFFHRLVEKPSHRLARLVASRVAQAQPVRS